MCSQRDEYFCSIVKYIAENIFDCLVPIHPFVEREQV